MEGTVVIQVWGVAVIGAVVDAIPRSPAAKALDEIARTLGEKDLSLLVDVAKRLQLGEERGMQ